MKTMKEELVWRLKDRPTTDDIVTLIGAEVITAKEAKTIAFNKVDENDKIAKLQQEVDLLKRVIEDQRRGVVINRGWIDAQEASFHPLVDPLRLLREFIN